MTQPIRALLLAAGYGTRLRPITNHTPKCLVSISGQPLLARWLRQLELAGCESVLVNTHYLSSQVLNFLDSWSSPINIHTTYEPELLGTAGTLMENRSFFQDSTGLLIHADNAMAADLNHFLHAHRERLPQCILSMLTFNTDQPRSCGIVTTSSDDVVTNFHEKVESPPGNRANGALYAFDTSLFAHLDLMQSRPIDFSIDVIPTLLNRIQAWHTDQPYLDIGTPDSLSRAQNLLSPVL